MTTVTTTPGIYIEEDASPAISVSQGATAIPLFIANFTPLDNKYSGVITRVSNWLDFSQKFSVSDTLTATVPVTATTAGGASDGVGAVTVTTATTVLALQLYFQNGGNACYLCALDDVTSDAQKAVLTALPGQIDEVGEITLIVAPENNETYRTAVYAAVLPMLDQNKGYFLLADSSGGKAPGGIGSSAHVAAYYPPLNYTPAALSFSDADVTITGYKGADDKTATTLAELKTVNADLAKTVATALTAATPTTLTVQPSALMAGVYCKTDLTRGVWKAPANVVLNGVTDVSVRVTDDAQGAMNTAGINVIRYFSDRGVLVWGSRTLQDDDTWRYIPVRRLFDAAERDIKKAMRPMIFEPNNQLTWKRVQTAIDNYLYSLWQQGGLTGNKASEAYFVRIGKDITMTQDDINQGKMIVQVGMAAVRPAEFIILQFTQNMTQ